MPERCTDRISNTHGRALVGLVLMLVNCTACVAAGASEATLAPPQDPPEVISEPAETPPVVDAEAVARNERLAAEIPEGWLKALESRTGNLHLVEYVPPDSAEDWRQKLSLEAMSGAGLPDPIDFLEGWARDQAPLCDDFGAHPIFSGFENGYPTVVQMLQCGRNKRTGKPLVTMVKAIKGNEALYTITRIWRLEAPPVADEKGETPLPIDQNELAGWAGALRKMVLCDPNLAAHPCADAEAEVTATGPDP